MPTIEHIITSDGSSTLINKDLNTSYHSLHGALQESQHIYIKNGLLEISKKQYEIKVFELGFGTGVNAWLSLEFALRNKVIIHFTSIEKYIVEESLIQQLNYSNQFQFENGKSYFNTIHELNWNKKHVINDNFSLNKIKEDWLSFETKEKFDLIYFDAFGPGSQSELWNQTSLSKAYNILNPQGILVTFCAQGEFRRTLKSIGFQVERLPGPPGKREMTKAVKILTNQ